MKLQPKTARRLAVLWTLGIALALAWPSASLPERPSTLPLDKLVHAGLFAGFGALWMRAVRGTLRRRAGWVTTLGLLLAAASEAAQGLLPFGRAPSLLDALADAAGLLLAVGAFYAGRVLSREGQTPRSPERTGRQ